MRSARFNSAFTLVELLVVVVVISVLAATATVAMARGSLQQRTTTTVQILQEIRSSIALYRVGASLEGTTPFPGLVEVNAGTLFPSGEVPANPFTGRTGASAAADLASAQSRSLASGSSGWVYFASTGADATAIFYANADGPTDRTDPDTGDPLTANEL